MRQRLGVLQLLSLHSGAGSGAVRAAWLGTYWNLEESGSQ